MKTSAEIKKEEYVGVVLDMQKIKEHEIRESLRQLLTDDEVEPRPFYVKFHFHVDGKDRVPIKEVGPVIDALASGATKLAEIRKALVRLRARWRRETSILDRKLNGDNYDNNLFGYYMDSEIVKVTRRKAAELDKLIREIGDE